MVEQANGHLVNDGRKLITGVEVKDKYCSQNSKKVIPVFRPNHFENTDEQDQVITPSHKEGRHKKTLVDFEERRITIEKAIPRSEPFVTVGPNNAPVAAPGDITSITAEGKAGKTAVRAALLSAAASQSGILEDFPEVVVKPNTHGKAIVDIDTEQSESDQQYIVKTILNRTGRRDTPEWFHSHNITTLPLAEYQQYTNDLCELCAQEFGGIHMIMLDGGADYTSSVNDEAEANAFIKYTQWLAKTYQCPVFVVIHLNEDSGKNGNDLPRGHLGRQAVRKGYAQLNITRDGDISTLKVLRARKAGMSDIPLICFKYDKGRGYHVSVDAEAITTQKQADKETAPYRKAESYAKKVFAPPAALRPTDAVSALMKVSKKTQSTVKRWLIDMREWGIVKKHDDGLYRLVV